ncbi:hypothetical protein evm_003523 [Chilo suppressalis]|nr:hypothetical protein evm_003523 [Chilo suppressalis]
MEASEFTSQNTSIFTEKEVLEMLSSSLEPTKSHTFESYEVPEDVQCQKEDTQNLSTKNAVKFLLDGTLKKKVCRYCLNVTTSLSELDQVLQVAGHGALYKVTIRDMIASFHPFKVAEDPNFPSKICDRCVDRTLSSYLFAQQCERSERALRNCFDDMYEKLEKLDPLEKQKKRGRQKLNPNHNTLFAEHENVIDYAEPLITIVNTASELITNTENINRNNDTFMCSKCCQNLPSLESLLNHEKSHPSSMWYHCHLCGKSFAKRIYLRRHIQSAHATGKQITMQKTDFKCQECHFVSFDYHTHLQHIEKHKFKELLQNLVTRKMDKLCAVCLNKGMKLVDMEKMVCLHGGYPEMMGDRTLYSILGSTVPEKTSYKYQELLIPSQAKILSIVKTNDKMKSSSSNFMISLPYVISTDCVCTDNLQQFSFSLPYVDDIELSSLEIANQDNVEDKPLNVDTKVDIYDHIENNINSDEALTKTHNFPEHIETDFKEDTQKKKVTVFKNLEKICNCCNTCWIFKKASCARCLELMSGEAEHTDFPNKKDEAEPSNQKCSSCWLFKNCKECGSCKNQNINEKSSNITETNTEVNLLDSNINEQGNNMNEKSSNNKENCIKVSLQNDINEQENIIDEKSSNNIATKPKVSLQDSDINEQDTIMNETSFNATETLSEVGLTNNVINENSDLQNTNDSPNNNKHEFEDVVKSAGDSFQMKKNTGEPSTILHHNETKSRKRKITHEANNSNAEAKKLKWHCEICLTTNTNRELCFCCDSPRALNKIKVKLNNDFLDDFNNNDSKTKEDKDNFFPTLADSELNRKNADRHTTREEIASVNVVDHKSLNIDNMEVDNTAIATTANSANYNSDNANKGDNFAVIDKHSNCGLVEHHTDVPSDNSFPLEEMEIVDDTPREVQNITVEERPDRCCSFPQFQFNIGTQSFTAKKPDRKLKRPFRKSVGTK